MKGINFKEPSVNATIERRKTETRRIITPQPDFFEDGKPFCETDFRIKSKSHVNEDGEHYFEVKPRYKVGEVVYLKEPYRLESRGGGVYEVQYLFGGDPKLIDTTELRIPPHKIASIFRSQSCSKSGFANKLFMPEWATRYFIRITSVRAERLQEIDDEGCEREGIRTFISGDKILYQEYDHEEHSGYLESGNRDHFQLLYINGHDGIRYETPREAYAALIDQINGRGTWDRNPYVWVYGYELCENSKI